MPPKSQIVTNIKILSSISSRQHHLSDRSRIKKVDRRLLESNMLALVTSAITKILVTVSPVFHKNVGFSGINIVFLPREQNLHLLDRYLCIVTVFC